MMLHKLNQHIGLGLLTILMGMLPGAFSAAQQPSPRTADPFAPPEAARQPAARPEDDPFAAPPAARPTERRRPSRPAASARARDPVNRPVSSARERIETELERTTNLDVVEMPLKDIVAYLSETHHIPILLSIKKLEEASISPDTPVTKSLNNLRLAAALNLMLQDLELAYYVDEVLVITTPEDAATHTEVRVYDCRDLLARQGEADSEPARVAKLMEIIQVNVSPETWQGFASGSSAMGAAATRPKPLPAGSVSEFDGLLVVTQTAHVHRKVEHLLNMLREAAGLERQMGRVVR